MAHTLVPTETPREHVSNVLQILKGVRSSPVAPADPASFDGYWVDRPTFEALEARLAHVVAQLRGAA